jgi:hypothetical protein
MAPSLRAEHFYRDTIFLGGQSHLIGSGSGQDPVPERDGDPALVRDGDPVLVRDGDPVLVRDGREGRTRTGPAGPFCGPAGAPKGSARPATAAVTTTQRIRPPVNRMAATSIGLLPHG